jgi:hypothetical protein
MTKSKKEWCYGGPQKPLVSASNLWERQTQVVSGSGWKAGVQHLPSMHKVLGSIPSTQRWQKRKKKVVGWKRKGSVHLLDRVCDQ